MGCTIIIHTGEEREDRHVNSLLEDAKDQAMALKQPGNKISVRTDRGGLWLLVPRQGNTGPGRWVWERG